ncbi:MAG: hypothetical protein ABR974_05855 [Bacteroidales bacterium]|jgi:hypothetical protein
MVPPNSNIDLVFRNGLQEFEILPPQEVWDSIRPSIARKKPAVSYLRAAAFIGLTLTAGAATYFISGTIADNFNGPAITLNQDARPEGKYIPYLAPVKPVLPVTQALAENTQVTPQQEVENQGPSLQYDLRRDGTLTLAGMKRTLFSSQKKTLFINNRGISPSSVISYMNGTTLNYDVAQNGASSSHKKRWTVGASISPTYYSKFDAGNPDPDKNLGGSEKAAMSYSSGFSFAFSVNKRFSIQMGLYYNSLNQEIDGVKSYSGFTSYNTSKGADNFTVETSNGTIVSRNSDIFLANGNSVNRVTSNFSGDVFDPGKAGLDYINSSIYQNFNYLEVPFVLRYKLIDRTIGMNLVGGISYNQLLNNSAYSVADGNKYYIGSTEGLYPVTLSSSFGVGMEYNFTKKLSLNLEPTFKYFLTPMTGQAGSSMHPYTFGIMSGLFLKF